MNRDDSGPTDDAPRPDPAFGRDAVAGPWARDRRPGGPRPRRAGRSAFVWLMGFTELGVLPLALAVGMRWWQALSLTAGIVALTAGVLALTMVALWRPWARRFPAQPAEDDAEVRLFQFVSLGALGGFNGCVEIASDAKHVRLELMPPFGWFLAPPISLPRGELALVRKGGVMGAVVVRLRDERTVTLPGWSVPEFA